MVTIAQTLGDEQRGNELAGEVKIQKGEAREWRAGGLNKRGMIKAYESS